MTAQPPHARPRRLPGRSPARRHPDRGRGGPGRRGLAALGAAAVAAPRPRGGRPPRAHAARDRRGGAGGGPGPAPGHEGLRAVERLRARGRGADAHAALRGGRRADPPRARAGRGGGLGAARSVGAGAPGRADRAGRAGGGERRLAHARHRTARAPAGADGDDRAAPGRGGSLDGGTHPADRPVAALAASGRARRALGPPGRAFLAPRRGLGGRAGAVVPAARVDIRGQRERHRGHRLRRPAPGQAAPARRGAAARGLQPRRGARRPHAGGARTSSRRRRSS